jgi:hypothetical protein
MACGVTKTDFMELTDKRVEVERVVENSETRSATVESRMRKIHDRLPVFPSSVDSSIDKA